MNLLVIKTKVEEKRYPGGLKGLAESVGMTEQNLHRCIRENKIQAHNLESISLKLEVPITEFFDEQTTEIRQAGRDYVEDGKIEHKGTEYNGPVTIADEALRAENERLKEELLEARKEIINLMKERR
ncbi:hypothetical protein [Paramuribaculum intestinale]|uniref:hypothetical protein n=1 Tax=Paramuribaculum intestinale TaxID=2094151 RepID=UPI0025A97107|nr:hypothetical protein [Paramuribaculum intestinale]